jgi:hypothetical protein
MFNRDYDTSRAESYCLIKMLTVLSRLDLSAHVDISLTVNMKCTKSKGSNNYF